MAEPTEKERETDTVARGAERRESRRVPIRVQVRDLGLGGSYEEYPGNVGIGGVYFESLHPPVGSQLELRILLPGSREEILTQGEVLRVSRDGIRFGAHVKFVDLPLDAELAIARFLERE